MRVLMRSSAHDSQDPSVPLPSDQPPTFLCVGGCICGTAAEDSFEVEQRSNRLTMYLVFVIGCICNRV